MIASSLAPPAAPAARTARVAAERPHAAATHGTTGLALRIALLAFAGVLVIAGVVRITFAGRARGWLGYSFPGVPAARGRRDRDLRAQRQGDSRRVRAAADRPAGVAPPGRPESHPAS